MRRHLIILLAALLGASTLSAQQVIDLAGSWQFAMGDEPQYNDYVMLPGSMLTNDKGLPVSVQTQWTGSLYDSSYYFNPYMERYRHEGEMKFPFFLTPEKQYVGNAWYQRTVYVPRDWRNLRIKLFLERPHIETTVYVNGKEVGHQMSLSAPHEYDVTSYLKTGQSNTIAVKVYNGIENVCVGQDSHSVTDQTQGNWNGIAGRIELQGRPKSVNIEQVRVYPDATKKTARVVVDVDIESTVWANNEALFTLEENGIGYEVSLIGAPDSVPPIFGASSNWIKGGSHPRLLFDVFLGDEAPTWDEFSPSLYLLTVFAGDDVYETVFGLRDIDIKGPHIYVNGRETWMRGTVENCCFPETGYPPTEEDEWLRIFAKCKEYGLNMVRFHSYCPPEAAFFAADRVGIYLQPEGPSWPNHGVKLRRGMAIDQYLLDESKRIVDAYGNHPSFVMMAAGNEPAGDWVSYCNDWVKAMHDYDPTKIYCGASVGGGWAWDDGSEYHVKGGARGLDWDRRAPSSDDDYYQQLLFPRNYKDSVPNQTPILAHEQGQWCAFPDLKETSQYTGAYKARNFEIFSDLLADNGMASQAEKFLMASGKLQTLCYKYEIERNLRTKDYAGFQLLGLNDYSGQGTALVGPLNVFWREKGYTNSREWREFCNPLVVLARFSKFVYTNDETLTVPVEAMNALWGDLSNCTTVCQLIRNDVEVLRVDTLSTTQIPLGKNNSLGTLSYDLSGVKEPAKMTLIIVVGNLVRNQWDFWVYPKSVDMPQTGADCLVTSDYKAALAALQAGKTVLLEAAGQVTLGSDVKQSYLPVFWNTSWFKMRPPHTTGAYIDKAHPLFRHGFPTDDWSNLNWWELLNKAQVMNLMELPADYQSPIQPIDTWHLSRKLGMLIEARVGKGRLLMTTMDIGSRLDERPVARQMRRALLSYMQSADFQPSLVLDAATVGHFFTKQAPPVNMFTNDSPDELKPKIK